MSGASSLAGVLLAEKKPPGKCHRKLFRRGVGRDGLIGLGKELRSSTAEKAAIEEHRSCHRLGDDFVGRFPSAMRWGGACLSYYLWLKLLRYCRVPEPKENIFQLQGPNSRREPSHPDARL
jgi:hypothetical protein